VAESNSAGQRSRPRVLVAGTPDAVAALIEAVRDGAEIVPAYSVNEALAELEASEFDTVACNVRFDESRMFEFLQSLTERKPGHAARVVAFRADESPLTQSIRSAIRHALEALGVERFVDLSQLRAEYGEEVAYEALRKIVLDRSFMPPAPGGQ
jgi:DNA-binding NarL/FixJ family response regulator